MVSTTTQKTANTTQTLGDEFLPKEQYVEIKRAYIAKADPSKAAPAAAAGAGAEEPAAAEDAAAAKAH